MRDEHVAAEALWRRAGFMLSVALILVLVLLGLGEILVFGVVGWLDAATLERVFPGGELHRVHGLVHGLLAAVLTLCVIAQLWRPRERFAAAVLGLTVLSVYTLAGLVSGTFDGLEIVGLAALAVMIWLHPSRPGARLAPMRIPVVAMVVPLIVGATALGLLELQAQLSAGPTDPHAALGHYGIVAALAATVISAVVIGSSSLPGAALSGWLGVVAAVAFGVASTAFPASASSPGSVPGVAAVLAGVVAGVGLLTGRSSREPAVSAGPRRREAI